MTSSISLFAPDVIVVILVWVVAVSLALARRHLDIVGTSLGILFVLSLLTGFVPLILQSLLLLIILVGCAVTQARWRTFAVVSAVASFAAGASPFFVGHQELAQLAEMREQYPIVSLDQRLAYEPVAPPAGQPALSPPVEQRLTSRESERKKYNQRAWMLHRLHDDSYARFVAARGFGAIRMIRVRPQFLELPEVAPIPLPDPPAPPEYVSDAPSALAVQDGERPAQLSTWAAVPAESSLGSLHWSGSGSFTDPERMGHVERRDRVTGFAPHRIVQPLDELVPLDLGDWQVTRLELISLLKHDPPRVYVSEHLPDMEELGEAVTRPLDEYESSHLPKLYEQQDLVFQWGLNRIRMLGSLRAGTDCLQCHTVRRGDLLGVFTYVLDRRPPVPEPALPRDQVAVPFNSRHLLARVSYQLGDEVWPSAARLPRER